MTEKKLLDAFQSIDDKYKLEADIFYNAGARARKKNLIVTGLRWGAGIAAGLALAAGLLFLGQLQQPAVDGSALHAGASGDPTPAPTPEAALPALVFDSAPVEGVVNLVDPFGPRENTAETVELAVEETAGLFGMSVEDYQATAPQGLTAVANLDKEGSLLLGAIAQEIPRADGDIFNSPLNAEIYYARSNPVLNQTAATATCEIYGMTFYTRWSVIYPDADEGVSSDTNTAPRRIDSYSAAAALPDGRTVWLRGVTLDGEPETQTVLDGLNWMARQLALAAEPYAREAQEAELRQALEEQEAELARMQREAELRVQGNYTLAQAAVEMAAQYAEDIRTGIARETPGSSVDECFFRDLTITRVNQDESSMVLRMTLAFKPTAGTDSYGFWWDGNTREGAGDLAGYLLADREVLVNKFDGQWQFGGDMIAGGITSGLGDNYTQVKIALGDELTPEKVVELAAKVHQNQFTQEAFTSYAGYPIDDEHGSTVYPLPGFTLAVRFGRDYQRAILTRNGTDENISLFDHADNVAKFMDGGVEGVYYTYYRQLQEGEDPLPDTDLLTPLKVLALSEKAGRGELTLADFAPYNGYDITQDSIYKAYPVTGGSGSLLVKCQFTNTGRAVNPTLSDGKDSDISLAEDPIAVAKYMDGGFPGDGVNGPVYTAYRQLLEGGSAAAPTPTPQPQPTPGVQVYLSQGDPADGTEEIRVFSYQGDPADGETD